ncbi:MAG: alpha/beta hydrolase, partial [Bacteroidales bacterium]|nr:alpha/beta hydrolase [Bacteroidales bacterium]
GIAVLRYDDRGVGASTGPLDSADTRIFSEDAEAIFNVLRNNPHVDTIRLGIGGHSEGGAIAPMVAARNKGVKFVVMLAGQGCTGQEVLVQQNEALFRAKGVSDSLVAIRTACMRELFMSAVETRPAASRLTVKDYQAIIAKYTSGLTKEQIDSIDLKKGIAYALKQQLDTRWMQTFLRLDPAEYLPRVTCPILALNGWKDCQVLCEPNQNRIEELTGGRAVCNQLRWLNHLFQHCKTGSPDEYMLIEETFDFDTMETIADWILTL